MIEIEQLHKSFGPVEVLRGIDMSVDRDSVVAILGPVGVGQIDAASLCRGARGIPVGPGPHRR